MMIFFLDEFLEKQKKHDAIKTSSSVK